MAWFRYAPVRLLLCLAALLMLASGCSTQPERSITLATTTSVQDSGLLEELVPKFRAKTGIEVRVVAVGTGQALEIGRRGDADILLVHDPDAEERFMTEGYGKSREEVMFNDFVIVGPAADPAGVKGLVSAKEAFSRIAQRHAPFVSRGDRSGTHQKEEEVWKRAGVEPRGDWYVKSGQGMGAVLRMADQKNAYALTDRATYLAHRKDLESVVLVEGDPELVNRYSVIVVSPERHPHVKHGLAMRFSYFLLTAETQNLIADFGTDRYGRALFTPKAVGPTGTRKEKP
jgi:tungstate transport system substrate-binding protein